MFSDLNVLDLVKNDPFGNIAQDRERYFAAINAVVKRETGRTDSIIAGDYALNYYIPPQTVSMLVLYCQQNTADDLARALAIVVYNANQSCAKRDSSGPPRTSKYVKVIANIPNQLYSIYIGARKILEIRGLRAIKGLEADSGSTRLISPIMLLLDIYRQLCDFDAADSWLKALEQEKILRQILVDDIDYFPVEFGKPNSIVQEAATILSEHNVIFTELAGNHVTVCVFKQDVNTIMESISNAMPGEQFELRVFETPPTECIHKFNIYHKTKSGSRESKFDIVELYDLCSTELVPYFEVPVRDKILKFASHIICMRIFCLRFWALAGKRKYRQSNNLNVSKIDEQIKNLKQKIKEAGMENEENIEAKKFYEVFPLRSLGTWRDPIVERKKTMSMMFEKSKLQPYTAYVKSGKLITTGGQSSATPIDAQNSFAEIDINFTTNDKFVTKKYNIANNYL